MAFKGLQSPAAGRALELARINQQALGEPQMSGYRDGSPQRFAGTEIANKIGAQADFAMDTKDKKNWPYFRDTIDRLVSFRNTFEGGGEQQA